MGEGLFYARQLDKDITNRCIYMMLAASTMRNFFNARSVFQIDVNLGATAGIAECPAAEPYRTAFLTGIAFILGIRQCQGTEGMQGLRGSYTLGGWNACRSRGPA